MVNKKTIFIFSFIFISSFFLQAQRNISGIVLASHSNEPVPFANVSIANTSTGTTTNSAGEFGFSVNIDNKVTLIVSHINYYKKEIIIDFGKKEQNLKILLTPKSEQIEEIIVSATLSEKPLKKATLPASIITQREISNHFYSNLADMLAGTPGFAQIWEYHSPLLLRGMNSNRMLVMKNGNRRIGTFPGGYFGQDMNIYDAYKTEIIKGPGSVIHGSGAISGIINIISPKPYGRNETNIKVISGYGSNNNEWLEGIRLCHKKETFGITAHGKWRKTDEYIYGNGEKARNSNVEDKDFSLSAGIKISNRQHIILRTDYHQGNWGKPRGFNGPEKYFTKIRNEEENLHTSISYKITPASKVIQQINADFYYDAGARDYHKYKFSTISGNLSSLDLVKYKDNYGGGKIFSVFPLFTNNKLTAGIDGYLFHIDNPSEIYDFYNNTSGNIEGYKNAGQQSFGFFINDEWQITEKTNIVAGLRYDDATVEEGKIEGETGQQEKRSALSGNAGFVFSPTPNKHISFNAGRAFRMPITEELFTETVSCKGIKKGNPELNPEYSWNFDLGFRGKSSSQKFKWDLACFYNIINDYIGEAPVTEDENIDFSYLNTDALLFGGEASASYRFDKILTPANTLFAEIGLSHVHGIDKSKEKTNAPLFGIPPFSINGELNYLGLINRFLITGYFLKLETRYAAAQNRIGEIPDGTDGGPWGYMESEDHTALNFSAGINSNSLPGKPKLRIIINNLTDNNYKPFGSYIPAMGRNTKLLLAFSF